MRSIKRPKIRQQTDAEAIRSMRGWAKQPSADKTPGKVLQDFSRYNYPGKDSQYFDWRNQGNCPNAATTVIFTYITLPGREGIIKIYGAGYQLGSPQAPGWDWFIFVNGTRYPINENITAVPFTILSATPQDDDLAATAITFEADSTIEFRVVNAAGVAVDIWARVAGWYL